MLNMGQITYEFNLLQSRLKKRSPEIFRKNLKTEKVLPHPLFTLRSGPPEQWEKAYWREVNNQGE
jgi:hypothetical protein